MYARTQSRVNIQIDMVTIPRRHTGELDLQQLRVLDALFRERSLTKAAAALNSNQPTISKYLSRARRYFDDPLFVRVNFRMEPTSRALEIENHVRHIVDAMEVLRREQVPFNAKTSERTFKIFTLDAGVIVFVPRMVKKIFNAAPSVRLRVVQADPEHAHSLLEGGELDLVIGAFPLLVKGIRKQRLFSTSYAESSAQRSSATWPVTLDARICSRATCRALGRRWGARPPNNRTSVGSDPARAQYYRSSWRIRVGGSRRQGYGRDRFSSDTGG